VKFDDTLINHQNLLKCCVHTLLQIGDDNPTWEVGNGTEIHCKRSGTNYAHKMFLWNGVWRWINPAAVVGEQKEVLRKGGFFDRNRRRR
jgi:hypothetical protein